MTIINTNSISGINSITAQGASGIEFYESSGVSQRLHISSSGQTKVTGADDQDNFIVDAAQTQFVIHQDSTDGEISLRAQDGSGNNYVKYMTFFIEGGSGPTERLRITPSGLIDISGGVQVSENITPTSGAGLELFREGGGGGQVQAFDRSGSAWLPLILKGSTQSFHTSGAERLQITSTGKLILPTGSPGIQFGSNDSGGNILSQTLDDYEEGTFTPTLGVSGNTNNLSVGYDAQVGRYIKVGRVVHFTIDMRLNSWSRGTATGGIMVKGLPFPPVDSSNYSRSSGFCDLYNWDYSSDAADIPYFSVYQDANQPWANIFKHRKGASSNDVSDPSNTSMAFLSGTYETGA